MLLLCSSNDLQPTLTATIYFMVVLSTCSTEECGLQLTEKMKSRSVVFRNIDMRLCQTECIGDAFIFASCRGSSGASKKTEKTGRSSVQTLKHPPVLAESCGSKEPRSKVCNESSQCVDQGCRKVCMEGPPLCDLNTASKAGDLQRVKFLVSQGQVDINCQEWIGRTPAMWAASGGHLKVVEYLLNKKAKLPLVDRFDINILHLACLGGDEKMVKYVLAQNMVDINGRVSCGRTAVMLAAERGDKDMVELLVDKGADVKLFDETGDNIFHCACRGGDAKVVKYILSHEMVDFNSPGHHNKTPVMVATEQGHQEVVELLLHRACYDGRVDVVKDVLSRVPVLINSRGLKRRTPVIIAEERGHKEVVELLVEHGADLSIKDKDNNNILHLASYHGRVDVLKYVLARKSAVDINCRGREGRRPVMMAAENGHKDVVELLVKHEAELFRKDRRGDNTLHRACYGGHVDVVTYLLSLNSVDINSRGWEERTPMMAAGERGHKEVMELLQKHGADLLLCDRHGDNILHFLCKAGHISSVKWVLSFNSVDINSRGWQKKTPVMFAAKRGHTDVVELLAKHGANLSLRDQSRSNILHIACFRGRFNVVKYVLSLNSVDINSRGMKKRTPLMVAAERGHKEVAGLLVKNKADLSLRDENGQKMLDLARQKGHLGLEQYVNSLRTKSQ